MLAGKAINTITHTAIHVKEMSLEILDN